MKILLIEDDLLIGKAIEQALNDNAYAVDWIQDGVSAINIAQIENYSLILLDLGLPGKDGYDVLKYYRNQHVDIPVLIITARDSIDDKIKGLDLGADDYLVKPFLIKELEARIRAILRRKNGQIDNVLTNNILTLDLRTKNVLYLGESYQLSLREFALLNELLLRPGAILSKEQLEDKIYGWNEEVTGNAVEVIIHGLRKKLGKEVIQNIRGLGWMVQKMD